MTNNSNSTSITAAQVEVSSEPALMRKGSLISSFCNKKKATEKETYLKSRKLYKDSNMMIEQME